MIFDVNNSPFLPVCPCQPHADPGSPYSDWQNVRWPENVTIGLEIKNTSLSYLTSIYLFILSTGFKPWHCSYYKIIFIDKTEYNLKIIQ